jgi:hypothetical protein
MKLPRNELGEPDTSALEDLLSARNLLTLVYMLGKPDRVMTLRKSVVKTSMPHRREHEKFLALGLYRLVKAEPGTEPAVSVQLTPEGVFVARAWHSETMSLGQLVPPQRP